MAASIDLEYPFSGRWLVQSSPARLVVRLTFKGSLPRNGEVIDAFG